MIGQRLAQSAIKESYLTKNKRLQRATRDMRLPGSVQVALYLCTWSFLATPVSSALVSEASAGFSLFETHRELSLPSEELDDSTVEYYHDFSKNARERTGFEESLLVLKKCQQPQPS